MKYEAILGAITISLASTFLLWFCEIPVFYIVGFGIFLHSLLPQHRKSIIVLISLSYLLFGTSFLRTNIIWFSSSLSEHFLVQNVFRILFILGGSFFTIWLTQTIKHWVARFKSLTGFEFFILLFMRILLFIGVSFIPDRSWAFFFVVNILLMHSWQLSFAGYDFVSPGKSAQKIKDLLYRFSPPWVLASFFYAATPKTESYWEQVRAKNDQELTTCRQSALKLLLWASFLMILTKLMSNFFYEVNRYSNSFWHLPLHHDLLPLSQAIEQVRYQKVIFAPAKAWQILTTDFTLHLLQISVFGHVVISLARFFGLNAPRNTQNPLAAVSILDFFSRYNYYYKEFLLNVFYYPLFFRFHKLKLKIRILISTTLSIGLGNYLFLSIMTLSSRPSSNILANAQSTLPLLVYCAVLTIFITYSQILSLRNNPKAQKSSIPKRLFKLSYILLFYALLRVFDHYFLGDIKGNWGFFLMLWGFPS